MPNKTHVGSRALTLKRNFDLVIRNSLRQTLNADSQLFVTSHSRPDEGKPYLCILAAFNKQKKRLADQELHTSHSTQVTYWEGP